VPDDLVDILNDQGLFNPNGDLTTKEILKKFSDRAAAGFGPRQFAEVTEIVGRHENPSRPPPRRVETDPSQWQQESSVRPMQQEPTIPFIGPPHVATPPPKRGPYDAPPPQQSPYGQFDQNGPPPENGGGRGGGGGAGAGAAGGQQQREWRNSGWGRQNSGLTTGTV